MPMPEPSSSIPSCLFDAVAVTAGCLSVTQGDVFADARRHAEDYGERVMVARKLALWLVLRGGGSGGYHRAATLLRLRGMSGAQAFAEIEARREADAGYRDATDRLRLAFVERLRGEKPMRRENGHAGVTESNVVRFAPRGRAA